MRGLALQGVQGKRLQRQPGAEDVKVPLGLVWCIDVQQKIYARCVAMCIAIHTSFIRRKLQKRSACATQSSSNHRSLLCDCHGRVCMDHSKISKAANSNLPCHLSHQILQQLEASGKSAYGLWLSPCT